MMPSRLTKTCCVAKRTSMLFRSQHLTSSRLVQITRAPALSIGECQQYRWKSTVSSREHARSPSKRRQFREIPVHPPVLEYIQRIGVGIPMRIKRRSSPSPSNRREEERQISPDPWKPPLPFGPHARPIKIVTSVGYVDEDDELLGFSAINKKKTIVPEVAIVGRSNVGKSTLLNTLLYGNRKDPSTTVVATRGRNAPTPMRIPKGIKAKTSERPGETRQITVYQLQSRSDDEHQSYRLRVTDLPGYGFAFDPEGENMRDLIMSYFLVDKQRGAASPLKRVLLLLDARHGMKKSDFDFLTMLQDELAKASTKKHTVLPPIQLVLTKCDLVNQTDLARRIVQVKEQFSECLNREPSRLPVMLVSARPRVGRSRNPSEIRPRGGVLELQRELASLAITKKGRSSDRKRSSK